MVMWAKEVSDVVSRTTGVLMVASVVVTTSFVAAAVRDYSEVDRRGGVEFLQSGFTRFVCMEDEVPAFPVSCRFRSPSIDRPAEHEQDLAFPVQGFIELQAGPLRRPVLGLAVAEGSQLLRVLRPEGHVGFTVQQEVICAFFFFTVWVWALGPAGRVPFTQCGVE